VVRSGPGFKVLYRHNDRSEELTADIVLSTVPAYHAAAIFENWEDKLAHHLNGIYYPPVKVLYLGFRKAAVGQVLDGFGFLIPEKENKPFLGAIWNSAIFPYRSKEDMAAFTLFIGGARSPELFENRNDRHTVDIVIKEFRKIMHIEDDPVVVKEKMWPRAIPQYSIGYIEHERYFERFESNHPGIFLSGNYRGGISVGDCIKNSELTAKRIREHINQIRR